MSNKYRLCRDFEVYSVNKVSGKESIIHNYTVFDILQMIGLVHANATKYPAFSWESALDQKSDSDPMSNLEAIFRHSVAIITNGPIDHESRLPHYFHLLCRLQMLVTGIDSVQTFYSPGIPDTVRSDLRHFALVTPAFLKHICTLSLDAIKAASKSFILDSRLAGDTTVAPEILDYRSSTRIWLAILVGSMREVDVNQRLFDETWLKTFSEELIAFCLSMTGREYVNWKI